MFYGDSVQDTRAQFFTSWEKFKQNLPLTPLESQIAAIIAVHPEYHDLFDQKYRWQDPEWSLEAGENPYLHLGLHLAIRDQIQTNRPAGIQKIHDALLQKIADPLEVEHLMMEQLAYYLWEAQGKGQLPAEETYLEALRGLL